MAAILRYLQEHQLVDSISTTIMIYLFVFILLLLLSLRYDVNGKTKGRSLWYFVILVLLILIAGFRWRLGSDTPLYLYTFYHETPYLCNLTLEDLGIKYPLWVLLQSIVLTVFGKFFVVQIIHAAFVNALYFKYIKKHSSYIFSCVLIYFIWMYTNQNMETMKASMAIVICLFGNDFILEKRWLHGFSLYIIASMFHISAIVMVLMPFAFWVRLDYRAFVLFVLAYYIGGVIQSNMGDYLMLLEMDGDIQDKLETYANSDTYGSMHNINYFIVNMLPFFAYSIFAVNYISKKDSNKRLLRLEPFLVIWLIFMILKLNVFIFYRYVQFYNIYFILYFVQLFYSCVESANKLDLRLSITRGFCIILPILIYLSLYNVGRLPMYYPYTSVFNRTINKERELEFSGVTHFIPYPNPNEY